MNEYDEPLSYMPHIWRLPPIGPSGGVWIEYCVYCKCQRPGTTEGEACQKRLLEDSRL